MTREMTVLPVSLTVNGKPIEVVVPANRVLVDLLRDDLGLTGTKRSCDEQVCGVCTVIVDGQAVSSCNVLAVDADGKEIETVEGLAGATGLHPLQEEFITHGAIQCGFCTPGMLMMAAALLGERSSPSREEIREYLSANLCRCTGYVGIERAVAAAARRLREQSGAVAP